MTSIYDFQLNNINGSPVALSAYRGKVLLIVNTASKCGYSRQLPGLQKLYESYREQGLEVLGFPCNQFNAKEPGNSLEVREYCEQNFGVTFPLFEKVEVRGGEAHPLFVYLTEQAPFRGFDTETSEGQKMDSFVRDKYSNYYAGDGVKWNFTKFLIARDGQVYGRYETTTDPLELGAIIQSLL
ncbi:glutathione peroxidase [Paenibacillus taihuensis]|uniref:Glutathione peroxidase n=1 Tax=Paenibacillus taihuensis TaxID=1156355 RepID=A0A3D9SLR7_9BACL|nr:glutathione peroxidase [Paenibacillus taihuensis]REE92845.1 glutathione peroxidase [Paenibacillus taihuensis]